MGKNDSRDLDRALELILRESSEFDRFTARFLERICDPAFPLSELDSFHGKWRTKAYERRKAIHNIWIKIFWMQWDVLPASSEGWFDRGIGLHEPEGSFNSLIQVVKRRVSFVRATHMMREFAEQSEPRAKPIKPPQRSRKPSQR